MPIDEYLTWIVPGRRAAVKKTVTYAGLMTRWRENLTLHRAKITGWYGLQGRFDEGIGAIEATIRQLDPDCAADVCRSVSQGSSGSSLDRNPIYVRLWKGPLRVLLEERAAESGGGETTLTTPEGEELLVTQITYRGRALRLELSRSHREVVNAAADFLMGDVVEFPLFTFLVACRSSNNYGSISFNPDGSFLCGTALLQDGQARSAWAEPKLHDNLIAMRFQLLLDMLRAAFYSLTAVFQPRTYRAYSVNDPEDRGISVHARGIFYGATWLNPTLGLADGYWQAVCNEWGWKSRRSALPHNLPTPRSMATLAGGEDPPVTPGISCSPTSLTLSSYMLNLADWGADSVSSELTPGSERHPRTDYDPHTSPYWGKFDETRIPAEEMLGESGATARTSARDRLRETITGILRDLGDPRPLNWSFVAEDALSGLTRAEQNAYRSPRNSGDAAGVFDLANRQLRDLRRTDRDAAAEQQKEARRAILRNIHRSCYDRFREVRRRLQELMDDEATWQQAEISALEVDVSDWPETAHSGEGNCTEAHGVSARSVTRVKDRLNAKLEEFEGRSARRNMLSVLRDVTVFGLSSHELSIVKVYSFDRLMDRDSLPLSDRMAAYDPLNGADEFPEGFSQEAQLFYLEASGGLNQWNRPNDGRIQACGLQPFKWVAIEDNMMYVWMDGSTLRYSPDSPTDGSGLVRAHRIRDGVLRAVYPGHEGGEQPSPADPQFKPFVILALAPDGGSMTTGAPLGDWRALFAERAVPFPTFKFAAESGHYPRVSEIGSFIETAIREATEDLSTETVEREQERTRGFLEALGATVAEAGS